MCVKLYITELGVLFGGHRTIEVQCSVNQSVGPLVNLYIAEVSVLFVDHGTTEAQFSVQHPDNPKTHVNSAPNTSPGT